MKRTSQHPGKTGRPPGRQHDITLSIRLPRPAAAALSEVAREQRLTVSTILHSSIISPLAAMVAPHVKVVRDTRASASRKLESIRALHLATRASLYLGPMGRRLGRAEAMECLQADVKQMERSSTGRRAAGESGDCASGDVSVADSTEGAPRDR